MTVIQAADKGKHLVAWQNNPYGHPAIIEDKLYSPSLLDIYRLNRNYDPTALDIYRLKRNNGNLSHYRQNNSSSITTNQQGKVESSTPN